MLVRDITSSTINHLRNHLPFYSLYIKYTIRCYMAEFVCAWVWWCIDISVLWIFCYNTSVAESAKICNHRFIYFSYFFLRYYIYFFSLFYQFSRLIKLRSWIDEKIFPQLATFFSIIKNFTTSWLGFREMARRNISRILRNYSEKYGGIFLSRRKKNTLEKS